MYFFVYSLVVFLYLNWCNGMEMFVICFIVIFFFLLFFKCFLFFCICGYMFIFNQKIFFFLYIVCIFFCYIFFIVKFIQIFQVVFSERYLERIFIQDFEVCEDELWLSCIICLFLYFICEFEIFGNRKKSLNGEEWSVFVYVFGIDVFMVVSKYVVDFIQNFCGCLNFNRVYGEYDVRRLVKYGRVYV